MPLKNDRLLRAIRRQPLDKTPIWLMRQAGRYLPEYRHLRSKAGSFMGLCKTPEYACEATLQPLLRFPLDAAILFSDILTIPDAMGLELQFSEGSGPYFSKPAQSAAAIQKLCPPDLNDLRYVYDAIAMIKAELREKIPLIGFCGSPFTLSAYMVEGKGKNGFPLVQKMINEDPHTLHKLLSTLAKSVAAHLNAQIEAGVDVVMIFDTWGGILSGNCYKEFSLFYIKDIISSLRRNYNKDRVPVILFTRDGNAWLEDMAETGCDVLGVDWKITLQEARMRIGEKMAIQGNLNPALLKGTSASIRQEVKTILASFGQGSGHIFNLGHGVTPDVLPEQVAVLVEAVHEESKLYHMNQKVEKGARV